jgi:Family of unknown function (DUF6526)
MADLPPQNRENHVRFHPLFHFFVAPALLVLFLLSVYFVIRSPGLPSLAQLLTVLVLGTVGVLARTNALKVQDRVIRLEEQLRLSALLGEEYPSIIHALSEPQLIALRFASDEEVPDLAKRAARERLDGKTIKAAIRNWRPDYWRV